MYFFASNVPYGLKEEFKLIAKSFKLKVRFDYRMKRFEAYGAKISKKKETQLVSFCKKYGLDYHSWSGKDTYSKSVYEKKK